MSHTVHGTVLSVYEAAIWLPYGHAWQLKHDGLREFAMPAGETLEVVQGNVTFEDVEFAYPSRPGGYRVMALWVGEWVKAWLDSTVVSWVSGLRSEWGAPTGSS